jgi:hypothetical protein
MSNYQLIDEDPPFYSESKSLENQMKMNGYKEFDREHDEMWISPRDEYIPNYGNVTQTSPNNMYFHTEFSQPPLQYDYANNDIKIQRRLFPQHIYRGGPIYEGTSQRERALYNYVEGGKQYRHPPTRLAPQIQYSPNYTSPDYQESPYLTNKKYNCMNVYEHFKDCKLCGKIASLDNKFYIFIIAILILIILFLIFSRKKSSSK